MRIVRPDTMRAMEEMAMTAFSIPGILLMENASRQLALEILSANRGKNGIVLLLAGPGNNGGDTFGAARHLLNAGCSVRVVTFAANLAYKADAAVNLEILHKMGVPIIELINIAGFEKWRTLFSDCTVVVDGIFGTGLKRAAEGVFEEAINAVNSFPGAVIAVDIASGVDAATGQCTGAAVNADITVTFGYGKLGHYLFPGAAKSGVVLVKDIGMPTALMHFPEDRCEALDSNYISYLLPNRQQYAHKNSVGSVLVVAGSFGMTGAAVLSSAAALRGGAGIVRCVIPASLVPIISTLVPEAVILPVEGKDGRVVASDAEPGEASKGAESWLKTSDSVLIGPGLPADKETDMLITTILSKVGDRTVILDAGALTVIAESKCVAERLPKHSILTPHPGEMARLMRCTTKEVLASPVENAVSCAKQWNAVVVLKGAGTVIAAPDGQVFINTSGNSGMATAGSGDVLAGLIASLAAQGSAPLEAAVIGVYLHGLSGDIAAQTVGKQALLASDLVAGIGSAYLHLEKEFEK